MILPRGFQIVHLNILPAGVKAQNLNFTLIIA